MADTFLLYDAYSLIYRAFYAIRSLTGPDGEPVNAIYGLTKMIKKLVADHGPSHHAAAFDLGAPHKRLALLPGYKAQRPPTPPDLDKQLAGIRAVLQAMRVPVVELDGEEADDIIATLAMQAARAGHNVLIASNDKDFMQLIGARIRLLRPDTKETTTVGPPAVRERFGVAPEQIVDFLSLLGDSVDNIPARRESARKRLPNCCKRTALWTIFWRTSPKLPNQNYAIVWPHPPTDCGPIDNSSHYKRTFPLP